MKYPVCETREAEAEAYIAWGEGDPGSDDGFAAGRTCATFAQGWCRPCLRLVARESVMEAVAGALRQAVRDVRSDE